MTGILERIRTEKPGHELTEAVRAWAARRGYRIGCADISVLDKARSGIRASFEAKAIDSDLYRTQLDPLCGGADDGMASSKRILIIAVPRPAHTVRFTFEDKYVDAVLPPTYVRYSALPEAVRDDLKEAIVDERFRLSILNAPLKSLAARIGLVRYGRNNITYIEGLGSYFQLVGYVTDMPLEPDAETPPCALSQCENCGACIAMCPTGAINEDRFLLNAARCLTLFSENEGDWPDFFRVSMLECLVGCLACQEICPENTGLFTTESTGICFSRNETAAILYGGPRQGPEWDEIREKLAGMRLLHYEPVIARNLQALLPSRASR